MILPCGDRLSWLRILDVTNDWALLPDCRLLVDFRLFVFHTDELRGELSPDVSLDNADTAATRSGGSGGALWQGTVTTSASGAAGLDTPVGAVSMVATGCTTSELRRLPTGKISAHGIEASA